jgi:DNA-directed RNA polymerase specialized sigma24 family protein
MRYGFEEGTAVPTCGPDIYFDEQAATADPMEMAREVLKLVVGAQNPGLQAEVLCLLMGVGFRGCSEQEIADRNGCTRAAISARMIKVRETLRIERAIGPMRQEITRDRCMKSRIEASMN